MTKSKYNKGIFFSIFFIVLMILLGLNSYNESNSLNKSWSDQPKVEGTLTDLEVSHFDGSWDVEVKYAYEVNQNTFEGSNLGSINLPLSFKEQKIRETLQKHGIEKNKPIEVTYRENKPDQSILFYGKENANESIIFSSVIGTLFTFILFILIRLKNKGITKRSNE